MQRRAFILYSHPGSYTAACLRELRERHDWELSVIQYPRSSEAPFKDEPLHELAELANRSEFADAAGIAARVRAFAPSVVYMVGWMDKGYLGAARLLRKDGIPVVAGTDTQYTGSVRQQVARRIAPWYLHSAIDVMWVTGERQRQLAWKLGYRGERCWSGAYCCDREAFAAVRENPRAACRAFLFAGRYVEAKGLDVLLAAYRRYREQAEDPWRLVLAGTGPLAGQLQGQAGVEDRGFVQPGELPALMGECGAFILPSRKEPWGVVVQEAAAAGLPLICSDAVGAAVHLVQDHYNGYVFASGSVDELSERMVELAALPAETRERMGRRGHALSGQFHPRRWADTLVAGTARLAATAIGR